MVAWQHEKEMGIIWPPHQPTSYMASLSLSCGLSLMWPIIPLLCGLFLPNLMRLLQISLSCGLYIFLSSCGLCFQPSPSGMGDGNMRRHESLMPPHSSLTLSCGLMAPSRCIPIPSLTFPLMPACRLYPFLLHPLMWPCHYSISPFSRGPTPRPSLSLAALSSAPLSIPYAYHMYIETRSFRTHRGKQERGTVMCGVRKEV